MPAPPRPALIALGAALALCACNSNASPEAGRAPDPPAAGVNASCPTGSAPDAEGRCAPRPQVCPMIYRPVCGADGRTYPNACHAERAGVGLAHDGACATGGAPLTASPGPSGSRGPSSSG